MEMVEQFTKKFEELYEEFENGNYDVEQDVYDLEEEIQYEIKEDPGPEEEDIQDALSNLLKQVKKMKQEFGLYDAETELDMMFPDRHDDDFDEDSMSWIGVFGDE